MWARSPRRPIKRTVTVIPVTVIPKRKAIINARNHKDAVAQLTDAKAIVGYDFSGGWA